MSSWFWIARHCHELMIWIASQCLSWAHNFEIAFLKGNCQALVSNPQTQIKGTGGDTIITWQLTLSTFDPQSSFSWEGAALSLPSVHFQICVHPIVCPSKLLIVSSDGHDTRIGIWNIQGQNITLWYGSYRECNGMEFTSIWLCML